MQIVWIGQNPRARYAASFPRLASMSYLREKCVGARMSKAYRELSGFNSRHNNTNIPRALLISCRLPIHHQVLGIKLLYAEFVNYLSDYRRRHQMARFSPLCSGPKTADVKGESGILAWLTDRPWYKNLPGAHLHPLILPPAASASSQISVVTQKGLMRLPAGTITPLSIARIPPTCNLQPTMPRSLPSLERYITLMAHKYLWIWHTDQDHQLQKIILTCIWATQNLSISLETPYLEIPLKTDVVVRWYRLEFLRRNTVW